MAWLEIGRGKGDLILVHFDTDLGVDAWSFEGVEGEKFGENVSWYTI